jgi:hypothetical protein
VEVIRMFERLRGPRSTVVLRTGPAARRPTYRTTSTSSRMISPSWTSCSSSGRNPRILSGGVDDHDDHRQVLGQAQEPAGVDQARGAETLHAADHARAGQAGLVRPMDDLGVQRSVMDHVAAADEDRRSQSRPGQAGHGVLLDTGTGRGVSEPAAAAVGCIVADRMRILALPA